MEILEYMRKYGHEQLAMWSDPETGLKAFIAIHDTTLGPSCGGLRIWPHATEEDAIMDVLRLSRAMTYKSAAAGLKLGGGKGLIWADSRTDKNDDLLRSFGRFVDSLGGRYITTEDVGMTPDDVKVIRQVTKHVVGLPKDMGGAGDTSPLTGLGVYLGMKAAAKAIWGNDSLKGRVIAMQGFGNVSSQTAMHLMEEGIELYVSDIHEESLERARKIGAKIVAPDAIYDVDADIFSPCALGGIINDDTITRIKAKVIAGGANNQLLEPRHGAELRKRGILYAPDYIINAGGIIQAAAEFEGILDPERTRRTTEGIYETTERVIHISEAEDIATSEAADHLAERRIQEARRLRTTPIGSKL